MLQRLRPRVVHCLRSTAREQRKPLSVYGVQNIRRWNYMRIKPNTRNVLYGFTLFGFTLLGSTTHGMIHANADSFSNEVIEINPEEMQQRRGKKPKYIIFDVRETFELEYQPRLDADDWINIPKINFLQFTGLESLKQALSEQFDIDLSEYDEIYCICQLGRRSRKVAKHLVSLQTGKKIFNIVGGMSNYSNATSNVLLPTFN
eukprot:25982_1